MFSKLTRDRTEARRASPEFGKPVNLLFELHLRLGEAVNLLFGLHLSLGGAVNLLFGLHLS
jgi:hypothetical protein